MNIRRDPQPITTDGWDELQELKLEVIDGRIFGLEDDVARCVPAASPRESRPGPGGQAPAEGSVVGGPRWVSEDRESSAAT